MQQFPMESQINLWLQATERGLFVAKLQLGFDSVVSVIAHISAHVREDPSTNRQTTMMLASVTDRNWNSRP
jgi:hypothetical protein